MSAVERRASISALLYLADSRESRKVVGQLSKICQINLTYWLTPLGNFNNEEKLTSLKWSISSRIRRYFGLASAHKRHYCLGASYLRPQLSQTTA